MNYVQHYNKLISRSKQRILEGYSENHHIIPRCMSGSDHPSNIVALTPEEHYIAHLLLAKIYPSNTKLLFAAKMMANRNNKNYGWVKRKFSLMIRDYNKGFKHSQESRAKMSKKQKGLEKSQSHKKSIGESHKKILEYKGNYYRGYQDLKTSTGVTRHLYIKFYVNDIDPEPYINNNTYAIIINSKHSPTKNSLGKRWYNNGIEEKYFDIPPQGWLLGRLKR